MWRSRRVGQRRPARGPPQERGRGSRIRLTPMNRIFMQVMTSGTAMCVRRERKKNVGFGWLCRVPLRACGVFTPSPAPQETEIQKAHGPKRAEPSLTSSQMQRSKGSVRPSFIAHCCVSFPFSNCVLPRPDLASSLPLSLPLYAIGPPPGQTPQPSLSLFSLPPHPSPPPVKNQCRGASSSQSLMARWA